MAQPLKEIRDRYEGMTLEKLAKDTGVNITTLWRIENGKNKYLPHKLTRLAIARVLAVDVNEIAEFTELKEFTPTPPPLRVSIKTKSGTVALTTDADVVIIRHDSSKAERPF